MTQRLTNRREREGENSNEALCVIAILSNLSLIDFYEGYIKHLIKG